MFADFWRRGCYAARVRLVRPVNATSVGGSAALGRAARAGHVIASTLVAPARVCRYSQGSLSARIMFVSIFKRLTDSPAGGVSKVSCADPVSFPGIFN